MRQVQWQGETGGGPAGAGARYRLRLLRYPERTLEPRRRRWALALLRALRGFGRRAGPAPRR